MAKLNLEDGYLPIVRELYNAIIQTNFSKRQRAIIDFIIRLSYGCGRKDCIIPKQKDFGIVGIGESHIKREVDYLIKAKVIIRDCDRYQLNKYHEQWRISINFWADDDRLGDLVHLNLEDKKLTKTVSPKESTTYRKGKIPENELTEKVSSNLPKGEVEGDLTTGNHSGKDAPRDSIKDSNRTITEREELKPQSYDKSGGSSLSPYDELLDSWNKTKPKDGALRGCAQIANYGPNARLAVKACFEKYSLEDLKQAATNFQENLNKQGSRGEWPATPLRLEIFYSGIFESYLPCNYTGGKNELDDSEVPKFIENV